MKIKIKTHIRNKVTWRYQKIQKNIQSLKNLFELLF